MMSVVLQREEDNKVVCYLKGADVAVAEKLANKDGKNEMMLTEELEGYAGKGLRTLMYAMKEMGDENEGGEEKDVELLGISGVED